MNTLRRRFFLTIFGLAMLSASAFAQKEFTQIDSNVVVANKELADELRSLTWRQADGTWVPEKGQVLQGLARLYTNEGAQEIAVSAIAAADMGPSLRLIPLSRYQVFGLMLGGRRQILFDASPKRSERDGSEADLWQKQTISIRVQDGGYFYWWALYDVELGSFVKSNRR